MKARKDQGGVHMTTRVRKWGNSLAIRIPSHIAEMISIEQGSEIEMRIENNEIRLVPKKKKPTLEDLLAKVTPENRPDEIDFGTEGTEQI